MSFFEQQEERKNKQFISLFDSIYFIAEYGNGSLQQALELLTSSFLKKQTYLLLVTPYSVKAVYVCSSYEQSSCEPYITFEELYFELKACIDHKGIGKENPIYGLGFAKKRFIEQLLNLGMILDEHVIFNTESPDITDVEYTSEGDEWAFYQGLPREYDTLRIENEKLKVQYKELFNKKGQPEAFYNIQKELYKTDRKDLNECRDKLDNSLLEIKALNERCIYLEQCKRRSDLTQKLAEKRILELENKLEQAKAELADKPANEGKNLNTKSQNYAAKIVLAMAQVADLDLNSPYACKEPNTTNSIIFDQIKTNGMKVSNQVIGNWLKLATEQTKDD